MTSPFVANIAGALTSGDITPTAQPQLQQALTLASGAMFTGVRQLQQIVEMLPAPAQGPVNNAIARITGILQAIFGNGGPATGTTPGGIVSNLPIPTNLPIPCGLPIPSFLPFAKSC